jgi:pyruvate dehydrogenase E2 component (dihydrolipoamide acetyltransferase)
MSALEIRLPALSATMEEATVLAWLVAPGDTVTEGQPIAEVATDKVDMELESPYAGTIQELLAEQGATVPLGAPMATIESEAEDLLGGLKLAAAPEAAAESPDVPEPTREPAFERLASAAPSSTIVPAAPAARRLARERGVDLGSVTPTGARGQVTLADLPGERHQAAAAPAIAPSQDGKRLSVRRATVEIMNRSAAIPQFALRRQLILDRAAAAKGGRSWTTELVRALAAALREHPEINACWDDDAGDTVPFDALRIGLAVDRPGVGLVVAAIEDPDLLRPSAADQAVRALVDRARSGRPKPPDMAQASATISNLGGFGIDRFDALLFPPQPAIMSVGSIAVRPVATSDRALTTALACEVGLTVDHRVADGADGARLLQTFTAIVEA